MNLIIEQHVHQSQAKTSGEFVFILIDDGICCKVIVDKDIEPLAARGMQTVFDLLADAGHDAGEDAEELATETGYAKVVHVRPGVADYEEHVWSYSLDGEVSLNYAFSRLIEDGRKYQ
ncbi:hypothetical protein J2T17_004460 [Paenibacillus mucilaginosus]|uniref:hypothetical protein n=1 Tax=Paenibacillus mucilaginosus TaxID=61624 RepID=UPI003D1A4343